MRRSRREFSAEPFQRRDTSQIAIVMVTALNGLAVLHAYFRVFTGTRHVASIDLRLRLPEQIAVLILTALIFGGGLYPQPSVASRYNAAAQLVRQRADRFGAISPAAQFRRAKSPRARLALADCYSIHPADD